MLVQVSQGTAGLWECDNHWKMYSKKFYRRDFNEKKKKESYSIMDSERVLGGNFGLS